MKVWFGTNSSSMKDHIKSGNKAFKQKEYKSAKKEYQLAKQEGQQALKRLDSFDNTYWTPAIGVWFLGIYYIIWRLIISSMVKSQKLHLKGKGFASPSKDDVKRMKRQCAESHGGTSKVISQVIGQCILFCDAQIKLCTNPSSITESMAIEDYIVTENFDTVEEIVEALLPLMDID